MIFRNLDLNLLRVFDEVMRERSLTKAARNLSLTQPAVSNALRRLRETLGDELLTRGGASQPGGGLQATPVALALWPAVRDALQNLQNALSTEAFSPQTNTSNLVLAMADATAAELIPPLVNVLERDAPGMSIRVIPLSTRDPRKLLQEGVADVALGFFPKVLAELAAHAVVDASEAAASAPNSTSPAELAAHAVVDASPFSHRRLYDGTYACVLRKGHTLAKQPLSLDDYCAARHLLVSFSGRPFGLIDESLASLGRRRRVVLTVNQFFTAGRVVANSNLLTVLPSHFVSVTGIADELVQQPLPFEVPAVHVDALWHHRVDATPAHAWLRGQLQTVARQVFGGVRSI